MLSDEESAGEAAGQDEEEPGEDGIFGHGQRHVLVFFGWPNFCTTLDAAGSCQMRPGGEVPTEERIEKRKAEMERYRKMKEAEAGRSKGLSLLEKTWRKMEQKPPGTLGEMKENEKKSMVFMSLPFFDFEAYESKTIAVDGVALQAPEAVPWDSCETNSTYGPKRTKWAGVMATFRSLK